MDKKFYTDLKSFFKKKGITQEYLASILIMSQPNLNAMLNGRRNISKSTATKLNKLYGLSVSWLLTGNGDMMDESTTTNNININRDSHGSMTVNGGISGGSIQQGGNLSEIVEKLVNELAEQRRELAEQRRASNKQQELINTLIEKLITDKKT